MWKHGVKSNTNAELMFGDLNEQATLGPKNKNQEETLQIKR